MRRVLLVHDNDRYRGQLSGAFAAAGFDVVECNNSTTALDILAGQVSIDAVVVPAGLAKPPSGVVVAMAARLRRQVPVVFVANPKMAELVPGIGRFLLASANPAEAVSATLRLLRKSSAA